MGQHTPSRYITANGHAALKQEFERLWRKERPAVTKALSEAAAEGDRSENAEYIYRKKQLREMDRRIRYLTKRLDVLTVVSGEPADKTRVYFAATVDVSNEASRQDTYRLVGVDEADARRGWISIDSPVAKALVGKRAGDEVVVATPSGEAVLQVVAVRYERHDQPGSA